METKTKICITCKISKSLSDFSKNRNQCRVCRTEVEKSYRINNPEKFRAKSLKYYYAHKEQRSEYAKGIPWEIKRFRQCQRRAIKKGYEFDLTPEYINSIYPDDNMCPLLNTQLKKGPGKMTPNSATIDRIDSTKGYIKGNVQVISHRANTAKNDLSLEEMQCLLDNWKRLSSNISTS